METTGRIKDISKDWKSDKLIVSFLVDAIPEEELKRLSDLEKLSIKAVRYSEKRSLSANAYFHVLVTKIADALRASNTEIKNRLIREYGAYEYVGDQIPTFRIKAEYEENMLNREDMHVNPVGREYDDGQEWVRMCFMRGSHTYNTAEMARLIDGAVNEAKELGIETLPPAELERMKNLWNMTSQAQG